MVESIKELRKLVTKRNQLFEVKGKENTSAPVEEYFHDRYLRVVSIYITWLFLHTKITPNQVSVLSMCVGILTGFLFSFAHPLWWIAGFIGTQLFHWLDAVDGEIARYRKLNSPIGKFFDLMAAAVAITAFFIGITIGTFNATGNIGVFLLGFICLAAFLLRSLAFAEKNYLFHQYALKFERKDLVTRKGKTNVRSRAYFIKKLFSFDGIPFIVVGLALLDLFFAPKSIMIGQSAWIINWRLSFLALGSVAGVLMFLKKLKDTAKLQKLFD